MKTKHIGLSLFHIVIYYNKLLQITAILPQLFFPRVIAKHIAWIGLFSWNILRQNATIRQVELSRCRVKGKKLQQRLTTTLKQQCLLVMYSDAVRIKPEEVGVQRMHHERQRFQHDLGRRITKLNELKQHGISRCHFRVYAQDSTIILIILLVLCLSQ